MKQYKDLLVHVLNNGVKTEDRTGVGTLSTFGYQMRFDLQEGLPVVTTKKLFIRGAIEELLWFIRGDTNERFLERRDVRFWKEWADNNGNLYDIYGKQLRRYVRPNPIVSLIKTRGPMDDGAPEGPVLRFPLEDPKQAPNPGPRTGEILTSNKCGDIRLLSKLTRGYSAQFVLTGTKVILEHITKMKIHDPYFPSYAGVGYYGKPHREYSTKEINLWRGILKRCYQESSTTYKRYGVKGVTVCKRWHCFANFLEDISTIPGYEDWLRHPGSYALDKDYYSANQYGPKTCVFVSNRLNGMMVGKAVEFEGRRYLSLRECSRQIGVSHKEAQRMGAIEMEAPDGFKFRETLYIDQLSEVIYEIQQNPSSRRHVITLWNPADIEEAKLPPCHGVVIQFYVAKGRLSCQMYQRSADAFLGLPINILSYAILTHLIAQQCSLEVGDLIWTGGCVHIYSNHLEQVEEQLSRDTRPLPTLRLNKKDSIFDYTVDDFSVKNYYCHPPIKAPVAV